MGGRTHAAWTAGDTAQGVAQRHQPSREHTLSATPYRRPTGQCRSRRTTARVRGQHRRRGLRFLCPRGDRPEALTSRQFRFPQAGLRLRPPRVLTRPAATDQPLTCSPSRWTIAHCPLAARPTPTPYGTTAATSFLAWEQTMRSGHPGSPTATGRSPPGAAWAVMISRAACGGRTRPPHSHHWAETTARGAEPTVTKAEAAGTTAPTDRSPRKRPCVQQPSGAQADALRKETPLLADRADSRLADQLSTVPVALKPFSAVLPQKLGHRGLGPGLIRSSVRPSPGGPGIRTARQAP